MGTYSVTVTAPNGCTATAVTTVTQSSNLDGTTSQTNIVCHGGSTGSSTTGSTAPYQYVWNDNITTEDRTGLRAGSYTVTVTDATTCQATLPVTLSDSSALTLTGSTLPVVCYGGSSGAVNLTVSGGTAP